MNSIRDINVLWFLLSSNLSLTYKSEVLENILIIQGSQSVDNNHKKTLIRTSTFFDLFLVQAFAKVFFNCEL